MITRTDSLDSVYNLNQVDRERKKTASSNKNQLTSTDQIDIQNSSVKSKLIKEKTLTEAMTIAQSSRQLIQKAMEMSARLKSIASQAIITGKIDQAELDQAVSGFSSIADEFGGQISRPATVMVDENLPEIKPVKVEFDQIESNINELKGVDPDKILPVNDKVGEKADKINLYIDNISSIVNAIGNDYSKMNEKDIIPVQQKATDSIILDSGKALISQGNINADFVQMILK